LEEEGEEEAAERRVRLRSPRDGDAAMTMD